MTLCIWSKIYHLGFFVVVVPLFVCFSGPDLGHMEVPRLGVELELQPPSCTTATATQDPSCLCDLHHSLWQCQILTRWVRPEIEPMSSWILVRFTTCWATTGTPRKATLNRVAREGFFEAVTVSGCRQKTVTHHLPLQGSRHQPMRLLTFHSPWKMLRAEVRNEALCALGKTGRTGYRG